MKNIFLILMLVFSIHSFSQEFEMWPNETPVNFATRCKLDGSAELTGNAIQANWNGIQNLIFAFYSDKETENIKGEAIEVDFVEGYVFVNTSGNLYKRIYIDRYFTEGADAEMASVFFANADKDKETELIVLCSWDQNNHAAPISGKLYKTYVYDHISLKKLPNALNAINFDKTFKLEFDGTNDEGKTSKATYKNANQIKIKLKQLGFK